MNARFLRCAAALAAGVLRAAADSSPAATSVALPPERLESWWSSVSPPAPRYGTRDFFAFALEAAAAGWRPDRVEAVLALAERKQDRDPASPTYGNFAWYWEDARPDDRNAVQFAMQKGALMGLLFRDRLTPAARDTLDRLFRFSAEGIRRHRVSPSYSNIYLKKTWNCLALGHLLSQPELAADGSSMLDLWLRHTVSNGVSEYLSPTYYAVDMENLGLIARHAVSPDARRRAGLAMEFFWTETAAHWFAPADRLGGPHSRDYDYLRGLGGLNAWARRAGWSPPAPAGERRFFDDACWVPPPAQARRILDTVPRTVRGRFSSRPGHTLAQWIGRRIAIGTAGAAYADSMDKVFVVLWPGADRPTASFLMDVRLDPYGQKKYPTGGGHMKAHHVFPFLTSVQRGREGLLLASAAPDTQAFRRSGSNLVAMLSHWVLPSDLPLFIGPTGGAARAGASLTLPRPDTPVFLRDGDAAAGFRFVWGTSANDGGATEIVEDGGRWKARRMTFVHSRRPPAARATIVTWARVAEGLDDAAFQAFRERFCRDRATVEAQGDQIDAAAEGMEGPLRLSANVKREERLRIEGADEGADSAVLSVNGTEIGLPLLRRALE